MNTTFDASVLLWGPLALLFLSAIVNAIIKQRARDLCLKEFHGDVVLVRMKDGEGIHGILTVYPDCLEIEFLELKPVRAGFDRQSYVIFKQRFDQIYCVYRLAPLPGTSRHAEWLKEIERLRKPSPLRRMLRFIRNAYNILRDALSQSVGMLIGIAKSRNPTLNNLQSADARAHEVTQTILGALPNAYEPVLEKYIGGFVVLNCTENNQPKEEIGILQDYSVQYLLLRDVVPSGTLPPELAPAASATETEMRALDIVFPRASAWVRHRARKSNE